MLSVVLGTVGAVIYGAADFLGGLAARRIRSLAVTTIAALAGLSGLLVLLPVVGGTWSLADAGWGALAGVCGVFATGLLYASLAIGPMSILSPLTAVVSAIAPMLWGLSVKGERISGLAVVALGAALVAVVLVGFVPGEKAVRPRVRGILYGVGSGLAIGGFLIALDRAGAQSGALPLVSARVTTAVLTGAALVVIAVGARRRGRVEGAVPPWRSAALAPAGPRLGATPSGHADLEHAAERPGPLPATAEGLRRGVWLAVACGIVDAGANMLLLTALRTGDLAVVSVLTALYPAGTILLAALVLRERIAAVQWVGLGLAIAAGAMFALA